MKSALPARASQQASSFSSVPRVLGFAVLCATGFAAVSQIRRSRAGNPHSTSVIQAPATEQEGALPSPADRAARGVHGAASLLALSVLADSALEHYRGQFENPGMFAPLLASLMTLLTGGRAAISGKDAREQRIAYLSALGAGAAGTGFHLYNVFKRPGGLSWGNLFYGAPLGAPAALSLAGILGLAANRLQRQAGVPTPQWLGADADRTLAGVTGLGIAGTSAEAALFHFRGAFHNPVMWLPVSLPPMAAILLLRQAIVPAGNVRLTRAMLSLTALLGIGGTFFHAYGVARQMGGWRNWSQNLLSGPPLPAPPSFSALALAGLAALSLRSGTYPERLP